jgi:hypothetical protein
MGPPNPNGGWEGAWYFPVIPAKLEKLLCQWFTPHFPYMGETTNIVTALKRQSPTPSVVVLGNPLIN